MTSQPVSLYSDQNLMYKAASLTVERAYSTVKTEPRPVDARVSAVRATRRFSRDYMKQDVNNNAKTPGDVGVSRRSMLKAVGATAVVGSVFPGVVAAEEGTRKDWDGVLGGEKATVDCPDGTAFWKFVLAPGGNQTLGTATLTTNYGSVSGQPSGAGGQGTIVFPPVKNAGGGTIADVYAIYTGDASVDNVVLTLSESGCEPENGNGDDPPQVHFYGCSQVCADQPRVSVTYIDSEGVEKTGLTSESTSNRNDPPVRGWDAVHCFAPEDGAIISAGGQDNPNRCAENYRPPAEDPAAPAEEPEEPPEE